MKSFRISAASTIALMVTLSLVSCTNTAARSPQPVQPEPSASIQPVNSQKPAEQTPIKNEKKLAADDLSDLEPDVGVIQEIQQGDLMCYITFKDETGVSRTVGATFEVCENSQQFINQRTRLVYGIRTVSDCQSAEPCGKTRRAQLVTQMHKIDAAGRPTDSDTVVLRNNEWTITVSGRNSWSGVNGTGNLTYQGCNSKQECIDLTGGTIVCRSGICSTSWTNGAYSYNLLSPITDGTTPSESKLVVSRNGKVLQEIIGLK